jgi:glyoxylase-like metal-dependent hydrolase (beta-lactamase superfamily II)
MLERDVAPGIHRIEDSFVNCYLVEADDGITLIDAALPRTWKLLEEALIALDRTHDEIKALVLTHAHYDHVGFAERARTELGIPVMVSPEDEWLARHPFRFKFSRFPGFYLKNPPFLKISAQFTTSGALLTKGVKELRTFTPGDTLDVPGSPVTAAVPGHTFGHVQFHFPDRDAVVVGDAIVTLDPYTGRVGPRLVARAATADVDQALASLDTIAATGAKVVMTGHGTPWTGGAEEAARLAREAGSA